MSFYQRIVAHLVHQRRMKRKAAAEDTGGGLVALAVSDFKNGVYSIGAAAMTFADMWAQDLAWSAFNPATHLIAGQGLGCIDSLANNQKGPCSTATLEAALALQSGITIVCDFYMARTGTLIVRNWISLLDIPGYAQEIDFITRSSHTNIQDNGSVGANQPAPNMGAENRVAITFAEGMAGYSLNGGAFVPFAEAINFAAVNSIALWVGVLSTAGTGVATSLQRKLTFYPPQALAALPALSTL